MYMCYEFKFVAVQSDGDIHDPEDKTASLKDLGEKGWKIAGVLNESAWVGFEHTLILQRSPSSLNLKGEVKGVYENGSELMYEPREFPIRLKLDADLT